jgi:excisionase family DNA binding protein
MSSAAGTADVQRLLTIGEVANRLRVSVRKAWRMIHTDARFPRPVRIGARGTRFFERDVEKYLGSLATEAR